MQDEDLKSMSDEKLQQNAASLQRERNTIMANMEVKRTELSKVNGKLEKIMAEIGARNYATMLASFVLTAEHITLLKEYGAVEPTDIQASDLQIAELLGWEVADNGLSERQESNIARLLSELKYAQSFINERSDAFINGDTKAKKIEVQS